MFVKMPVYSKVSVADKERLYQAHVRGDDYVRLAEILGINRTTAYHIIRRGNQRDGVVALPRGGKRTEKVTAETQRTVLDIVHEHPDFTLVAINRELRARLPGELHVSTSTISNILQVQLITMKKLEDAPAERNSDATKEQRFEYCQWLMGNIQRFDLIFVDEAGINLWLKRTRGRARRGERAVRVAQGRRGHNLTMTFAVSARAGLIHHDLFQGGMTAERFNGFLNHVSEIYQPEMEVCFVFDNARAHMQARNLELPKGFNMKYLPPYSPFLNICENAFSIWKQALKTRLAEVREQTLDQPFDERIPTLTQLAVQETIVVTEGKMDGAFRHMQSYMPLCFGREDVLM